VARIAQIREEYLKRGLTGPATAAGPSPSRVRRRVLEDQLASLKRENDDLGRTMYEAAQVQRRLCGPRYFHTGGYEFAGEIFPLRHLSGDFIILMQLEGDLIFAIGDIAGKGVAAGIWFTLVVGMIRRAISTHCDPAAALLAVDRDLLLTGVEFPLTTLFLGRLKLASGELTFCNAGHPAALLIRHNGDVEELSEGGPILGVISGAQFVNGRTTVGRNNTLVAYSDGIAECRNESGVEFGTERLLSALQAFSNRSPSATLFSVLAAVENFVGNGHREDDIALLVLDRLDSCATDRSQRHAAGRQKISTGKLLTRLALDSWRRPR
jgi:serine phosphatase RsbU (regulator of sigma subunit)